MRKTVVLLTAVLLLGLVLVGTALAKEKVIEGSGGLHAAGTGEARLNGSGEVSVDGKGVLVVKLISEDATVTVHGAGDKKMLTDGTLVYRGYRGHARISGSRIKVGLTGSADLTAVGAGRVRLQGHGVFHIGDKSGRWRHNGVTIYYKK